MSPRFRSRRPTSGVGTSHARCIARYALIAAGTVWGFASCTTRRVTEVEIRAVDVSPPTDAVMAGSSTQLNARVSDERGTTISQAVVEWTSDSDSIAVVDENGLVTGKRAGTTTIRATFRGVTGTAQITVDPGPHMAAAPGSVALFGPQGSSPRAEVLIVNDGVGTLSGLSASVQYEGVASGWLPVSLTGATAPATLTVTASTEGLPLGTYAAAVSLSATAGNSPLTLPVTLVITEDEPIIGVAPASITFEGTAGQAVQAPVVVDVTNVGGGSLTGLSASIWYGGSTAGWLSTTIASSIAPTELSVSADASGLPPGTHHGEVRVSSPVAVNAPESIPITFVVAAPPDSADVRLIMSGPAGATSGDRVDYGLTVLNAGPDTARQVLLTAPTPAGTLFVSSTAGTHAGGVLTWDVGTLPAGVSRSVTVRLEIVLGTTGGLVYAASVASPTPDPLATNNNASVTTAVSEPTSADVSIVKSAPPTAQAGSRISYGLSVANAGPDLATAVAALDTLPSGVNFVSSTGGSFAGGVVSWNVGNLAAGAHAEISVVVDVTAGAVGTSVNRAHVASATIDPVATNNHAQASTTVSPAPTADLVVSASAPETAKAGADMTVHVTAQNAGPSSATSVTLRLTLPTGVSFRSATGGGSHSGGVVTWSLGTLGAGSAPLGFDIVVRPASSTSGSVSHTVTATSTTLDPNPGNSTATATTVVIASNQADVAVTIEGPSSAARGALVRYDVTVTNNGPAKANQVNVSYPIPDGMTFVLATRGEVSGGVLAWSHGNMNSGSSYATSVYLQVDSSATGSITNSVAATSTTADPYQVNNTAAKVTSVQ